VSALVNRDEAALRIKGPGGTKIERVLGKLRLHAKGTYRITMVHQAPDDNHLVSASMSRGEGTPRGRLIIVLPLRPGGEPPARVLCPRTRAEEERRISDGGDSF
jgi:hypothetical protein